jgi:uncharacterized protein (TIGR02246 family)
MKATALSVFIVAALAGTGFAKTPPAPEKAPAAPEKPAAAPETPPETAAVIANDRAYEAAYAKADVKALADFFADDAEYTADDGSTYSGKAEIEKSIREAFRAKKGAKLTIDLDSVKVLSPDVVLEKGSTTVTEKDGDTSGALYTAIYVKKEGKWKITQLVETPLPAATPQDHLSDLGWLVGKWEEADKSNDLTIESQYSWARGGNFITRNVTVKHGEDITLQGWQIIGWDPVEEKIRVWTYDDEGGFSDGYMTRDGERWLLRETGYASDGSRTASEDTITRLSNDRFSWESNNRSLDGDPLPNIDRVEISRVKGN